MYYFIGLIFNFEKLLLTPSGVGVFLRRKAKLKKLFFVKKAFPTKENFGNHVQRRLKAICQAKQIKKGNLLQNYHFLIVTVFSAKI